MKLIHLIRHFNYFFALIVCASIFFMSCDSNQNCHPKKYSYILNHYQDDSVKQKAAHFIIDNIAGNYSIRHKSIDKTGVECSSFLSLYSGELSRKQVMDSMQIQLTIDTIRDIDQLSTDDLIQYIDEAFEVYNKKPLKFRPNLQNFIEYVLPYRINTEELEHWMPELSDQYSFYINQLPRDSQNIYSSLEYLNQKLYSAFRYANQGAVRPSNTLSVSQLQKCKSWWSCHDLTAMKCYMWKSLGIPAAFEIIPYWGKMNGGHFEAAISMCNDKLYPAFSDTLTYRLNLSKMYRKTFKKQPNPYELIKRAGEKKENIPSFFNTDNILDITNERTVTSDIIIPIQNSSNKKVYYLAIYSFGNWLPIEWSALNNKIQKFEFRNMGRNVLYNLVYCEKQKIIPIGDPFILDSCGDITNLKSGIEFQELIVDNNKRPPIYVEEGKCYRLSFWNNSTHSWIMHSETEAKKSKVKFSDVPINTLYKIEDPSSDYKHTRPFSYRDGIITNW
jgi:hypothetical protein